MKTYAPAQIKAIEMLYVEQQKSVNDVATALQTHTRRLSGFLAQQGWLRRRGRITQRPTDVRRLREMLTAHALNVKVSVRGSTTTLSFLGARDMGRYLILVGDPPIGCGKTAVLRSAADVTEAALRLSLVD